MRDRILVIGGYGAVGLETVKLLDKEFPGRISVAGRDSVRAAELLSAAGLCADVRRINMADGPSIRQAFGDDIGLAVCCMQQHCPFLQKNGIAAGVNTIDAGMKPSVVSEALWLGTKAAISGSWHLVSAGLFPGAASILAAAQTARVQHCRQISAVLHLSAWPELGPDGWATLLDLASGDFEIDQLGRKRLHHGIGPQRRVISGSSGQLMSGPLVNLPELYHLHHTLRTDQTFTSLLIDARWQMAFVRLLAKWPIRTGIQRHMGLRSRLARLVSERVKRQKDSRVTLTVSVEGETPDGQRRHSSLAAQFPSLARGAGLCLAAMAKALIACPPGHGGVYRPEEAFRPDGIIESLQSLGGDEFRYAASEPTEEQNK